MLFVAIHQVEIELRDAQAGKFGKLVSMRRGGSKQPEAIDDFVRNEIAVAAVDFAVMEIIVAGTVADIGGQRERQILGSIALRFRSRRASLLRTSRQKPSRVTGSVASASSATSNRHTLGNASCGFRAQISD